MAAAGARARTTGEVLGRAARRERGRSADRDARGTDQGPPYTPTPGQPLDHDVSPPHREAAPERGQGPSAPTSSSGAYGAADVDAPTVRERPAPAQAPAPPAPADPPAPAPAGASASVFAAGVGPEQAERFRALVARKRDLFDRRQRLDSELRVVRDELRAVVREVDRLTDALVLPVPEVEPDGQLNLLHDPPPPPDPAPAPRPAPAARAARKAVDADTPLADSDGFPRAAVRPCERAGVRTVAELVRWIGLQGGAPWNDRQLPLRRNDAEAVQAWLLERRLLPEGATVGAGGGEQRPEIARAARAVEAALGASLVRTLAQREPTLEPTVAQRVADARGYIGPLCARVAESRDWWKGTPDLTAALAGSVERWIVQLAEQHTAPDA